MLDPLLFETITNVPSEVTAPPNGLAPVEIELGVCGDSAPVAGRYLYCDSVFELAFTTNTVFPAGFTAMATGAVPAPTGEPEVSTRFPSGDEQVAETCMHAANVLSVSEPALATKRVLASAAAQLTLEPVTPAHREKASADRLLPVEKDLIACSAPVP